VDLTGANPTGVIQATFKQIERTNVVHVGIEIISQIVTINA
jgi:hypothetical protein